MKSLFILLLALAAVPASVYAKDINFITPADLPKSASRLYSEHGRGLFSPPTGYGVDQAMASSDAEEACMAKVGRQLTDWNPKFEQEGNYWFYSISAEFECLAPTLSLDMNGEAAKVLVRDLKNSEKKADVLCYSSLDEVCNGSVLITYQERYTCEIYDLKNAGNVVRLEDILEDGAIQQNVIQDQGARKLASDLPVYVDYRRNDQPGANCGGHVNGKLKGISRKAATIRCDLRDDSDFCHIDGIIDVK
jgi:hypothetical protein